ncbi:MAG: small multi-drug export protein [Candidatus Nezhaarchaeales archaeon]
MIPEEVKVLILALTPLFETRISIPYGIAVADLPVPEVMAISLVGNLIPLPFLLWGLSKFERWALRGDGWLQKVITLMYVNLVFRVRRRGERYINRYGVLGLALFVAIPLPGSGVWAGSLLAHILGLSPKKSLVAITVGALVAALLVLAGTFGITILMT